MRRNIVGRVLALGLWAACWPVAGLAATATGSDPLYQQVAGLDTQFFESFNHCDAPQQLQRHGRFLDPDVEFYHDTGGVSWTRDAYLAKTGKNVCGHFRRQLKSGSLEVYPVKGFGAIEQGVQRFCQIATGKCSGEAKFLILWRRTGSSWQITRAFSYGHHPID
ncbi:nuclear transport factor 2 family protein [Frateuria aurantia]